MAKRETVYEIYDGRYHTDPYRAICCEVCESLKEARKNKSEYGNDTVIVKTVIEHVTGNNYKHISSEVVN